jgi:AGCS family alanine or glycine:cation symporter
MLGSKAVRIFLILYVLVSIAGATMDLGLIWSISETFNGLMAIPNLIAVFLLSPVVLKLLKEHTSK